MGFIDLIIGVLLMMSYSDNLFAVIIISIILLRGITTFIQILPPLIILLKIYSLVDLAIPFLILFSYGFSNSGVNLIFIYFLIKIGYSLFSYFLIR